MHLGFIGQSTECAVICNNKWITKSILNSNSIPTLNGHLIHNSTELKSFLKNATGIYICKPLCEWSGKGQFILNTKIFRNESINYLNYPFIIEEFITAIEISVDIFTHNSNHVIYPPVYKGITSVETRHALNRLRFCPYNWSKEIEDKILNYAKRVAIAVQSTGWLDIDMLLVDDNLYVLEVNSRFSGTTRMISMVSKIDPYEITVKAALGEQIDNIIINRTNGISFEVPFYQNIQTIQKDHIFVYYSSTPHLWLGKITAKVDQKKLPDDIKKLLIEGGITEYIKDIETFLENYL
ncbi:MAG: ATP-grasp domain-containing protein [Candidatus Lokiarchaeota archaeon]|nr:ATP-grasp domain-containing protein [Candidatus Lokiarchaeota archaeon]